MFDTLGPAGSMEPMGGECARDSFTVSQGNVDLPIICGDNTGQHSKWV